MLGSSYLLAVLITMGTVQLSTGAHAALLGFVADPGSTRERGSVAVSVSTDTSDLQQQIEPRAGGDVQPASEIPSGLIELTADQLARLGVHYDSTSISYVEEGIRFVVSTSGIALTGSNGKSDARTPRHVTLYEDGKHVASWKRSYPGDDIDRLVGVFIRLKGTAQRPSAHNVVAVIWCIPPADMQLPVTVDTVANATGSDPNDAATAGPPSILRTALRPNPVAGSTATLTIEAQRACAASVTLYDMLGNRIATITEQAILESGAQDITLSNLHEQAQGMYMVVIDVPETRERHARRLLIER